MNNIRKHAKASAAIVTVNFLKSQVRLTVKNNGIGFDTKEAATRSALKGSLGTKSMQERAKLIGANLKIESEMGKGTVVKLEAPL